MRKWNSPSTPFLSERVRSWRWWPAIALAALFAAATWGVFRPQLTNNPPEVHAANHKPDGQSKGTDPNEKIAAYTFWLMLFTGVLAGVGGTQGYLLLRQVGLARDEFNATHRPRVRVRRMSFDGYSAAGIFPAFMSVVNVGEGQATITGTAAGFYLREGSGGKWRGEKPSFNKFGVPPNPVLEAGQLVGWMATGDRALTTEDYLGLVDGELQLWLIGEIRYRDAANITRQTGFAWACDRHSKEFFRQKNEESYDYED